MLRRTWRRKVSRKPRRFFRKSFSTTKPPIPLPVIPFSNPTLPTTSSPSLSTFLPSPTSYRYPLLTLHFLTALTFPLSNPMFCRLESGPARFHDGYSKLRTWTYSSLDLYKVMRAFSLSVILFSPFWFSRVFVTFLAVILQHELLRVLYPVFIHCFMDLVAKGHVQEGNLMCSIWGHLCMAACVLFCCCAGVWLWLLFSARNFFNTFREDHEMMHLRDLQKLEGVLSPTHLQVGCCLKFCIGLLILSMLLIVLAISVKYSYGNVISCAGNGIRSFS